jgi:hypothetical protein
VFETERVETYARGGGQAEMMMMASGGRVVAALAAALLMLAAGGADADCFDYCYKNCIADDKSMADYCNYACAKTCEPGLLGQRPLPAAVVVGGTPLRCQIDCVRRTCTGQRKGMYAVQSSAMNKKNCPGFKLAFDLHALATNTMGGNCILCAFFIKKNPSWLIGRSHGNDGLLRQLLQWLQDESRAEARLRRPALPREAGRRAASLGARRAPLPREEERRPAGDGTRPSIPREAGRRPAGGSAGPPLIIVGERGPLHPPSP